MRQKFLSAVIADIYYPEEAIYTLDRNLVALNPASSNELVLNVTIFGETLQARTSNGRPAVVDFSYLFRSISAYYFRDNVHVEVHDITANTMDSFDFILRFYHGKTFQGRGHIATDIYAQQYNGVVLPLPHNAVVTGGNYNGDYIDDVAVYIDAYDGCDTDYHIEFGDKRDALLHPDEFVWSMGVSRLFINEVTFHTTNPSWSEYDGLTGSMELRPRDAEHRWVVRNLADTLYGFFYVNDSRLMWRNTALMNLTLDAYDGNGNVVGTINVNHQIMGFVLDAYYYFATADGYRPGRIEFQPDGIARVYFYSTNNVFEVGAALYPMVYLGMYGLPSAIGGNTWTDVITSEQVAIMCGPVTVAQFDDNIYNLALVRLDIADGGYIMAVFRPGTSDYRFDVLFCTSASTTPDNVTDFYDTDQAGWKPYCNVAHLGWNFANSDLAGASVYINYEPVGGGIGWQRTYILADSGAQFYFAFAPCNYLYINNDEKPDSSYYFGWQKGLAQLTSNIYSTFSVRERTYDFWGGQAPLSNFFNSSVGIYGYGLRQGNYCQEEFIPITTPVCSGEMLDPDGGEIECGDSFDIMVHAACLNDEGGAYLYYMDADGAEQYYPCKIISRVAATEGEEFPDVQYDGLYPRNVTTSVRERIVVALCDVPSTFHIEDVLFSPFTYLLNDYDWISVAVLTRELERGENIRDFAIELLTNV